MHVHLGVRCQDLIDKNTEASSGSPGTIGFHPRCHYAVVADWGKPIDAAGNVIVVSIPSVLDPSLAPPGCHTVHAYTWVIAPPFSCMIYELFSGMRYMRASLQCYVLVILYFPRRIHYFLNTARSSNDNHGYFVLQLYRDYPDARTNTLDDSLLSALMIVRVGSDVGTIYGENTIFV